eukprot:TRINITY_DN13872_c0_g1_i1.p1 TRINITY_DN13872_c0_g1~~TRINITY_DN13872_c0_g1_i1.p1  ORF type:complete len:983 (-),score=246.39 TRINITY_DN13872_c0_g1_i1:58-3006(-)
MGASQGKLVQKFCGPFFGVFKDIHESPPGSESESEADSEDGKYRQSGVPAQHAASGGAHAAGDAKAQVQANVANVKRMLAKNAVSLSEMGPSAGLQQWLPYLTSVKIESRNGSEVTEFSLPAVRATRINITEVMIRKLPELPSVHTLELAYCKLKAIPNNLHELDGLRVVRLPHNKVTSIIRSKAEKESGAAMQLETLSLEWNRISTVGPGAFADDNVRNLIVLNLSHNIVEFLPNDFMKGANKIRFIDLSHNRLQMLPSTIVQCRALQLLIVHHNELESLPEDIHWLKDLRKLFVAYNRLTYLPETIGLCSNLEKLRFGHNRIRFMPDSAVLLWKRRGGCLEEMLVDENPLIQPSITAFQMGGLDQAFQLFDEWLLEKQEEQEREQQRALQDEEFAIELDGSEPSEQGAPGVSKAVNSVRPSLKRGATKDSVGSGVGWSERDPGARVWASQNQTKTLNQHQHHRSYYFGHLPPDEYDQGVSEIRSAEASILLHKKAHWFQEQVALAEMKEEEHKTHDTPMEASLEKFLSEDFTLADFDGKVTVTDTDLYFILLVYSTKPMFSTCQALFDKFESGADTKEPSFEGVYLDETEWSDFCKRAPVKIPDTIRGSIWRLLAWRHKDRVYLKDFVAGWHLHDVEEQDPWIARITAVLQLDYYDMNVGEMRDRLRAVGGQDATPDLDFDSVGDAHKTLEVPLMEGELRRLRGAAASAPGAPGALVSAAGDEEASDESGDHMVQSAQLSQASETEEENLDARDCLREMEERLAEEARRREATQHTRVKMPVKSDADLARLMTLPPSEILWQPLEDEDVRQDRRVITNKGYRRRRKLRNKQSVRDRRFRTDVFTVRQAIREACRNLPFEDFVKLVNFILRGLRLIQHYDPTDRETYWHAEDPTFKDTIAWNPYTRQLLLHTGFVCVNDVYWVWPQKHLCQDFRGVWGASIVPPNCPGKDRARLQDMIDLFRSCQRVVCKEGRSFSGHFLS